MQHREFLDRYRRLRIFKAVGIATALLGLLGLLTYITVEIVGGWAASILLLILGVLSGFVIWKDKLFHGLSTKECARELDRVLQLKERFCSAIDDKIPEGEKKRYLRENLDAKIDGVSPRKLQSASKYSKRAMGLMAAALTCLYGYSFALTYFSEVVPIVVNQKAKEELEKLAQNPELPPEVIQAIVAVLDQVSVDGEQIDQTKLAEAIDNAANSIEAAKGQQNTEPSETGGSKGSELKTTPTPTPTPSPTPTPTLEKPDSEQNKKDDTKIDNSTSSDNKDKPKDQKKDDSKKQDEGSKESSSEGSDKPDQKSSNGGNSSKEDQNQKDGKKDEGKKGDKNSNGKDSEEKESKDSQNKDSKSKDASGKNSEGKDQKGDDKKQKLDEAASSLKELTKPQEKPDESGKKPDDKNSGEKKPNDKKGDQPGQMAGDKKSDGKKDGDKGDQKQPGKDGQKQDDKKDQSSEGSGAGEKPADKAEKKGERADKKSVGKPGNESGEATSKTTEEAPKAMQGERPGGTGIKASSYEEKTLGKADEKTDSRYTGDEATIAKNKGNADPKTALGTSNLDQGAVVEELGSQPIPLEYKDLLN